MRSLTFFERVENTTRAMSQLFQQQCTEWQVPYEKVGRMRNTLKLNCQFLIEQDNFEPETTGNLVNIVVKLTPIF